MAKIEKIKIDMIFEEIGSLDENIMPQLTCPSCGAKFECKKTDSR